MQSSNISNDTTAISNSSVAALTQLPSKRMRQNNTNTTESVYPSFPPLSRGGVYWCDLKIVWWRTWIGVVCTVNSVKKDFSICENRIVECDLNQSILHRIVLGQFDSKDISKIPSFESDSTTRCVIVIDWIMHQIVSKLIYFKMDINIFSPCFSDRLFSLFWSQHSCSDTIITCFQ